MEAICSSEMSVDFQWTTRRYIPEDSSTLNSFIFKNVNIGALTTVEVGGHISEIKFNDREKRNLTEGTWLRHCAISQKVSGSIFDEVI
jgi:hypothetical protein